MRIAISVVWCLVSCAGMASGQRPPIVDPWLNQTGMQSRGHNHGNHSVWLSVSTAKKTAQFRVRYHPNDVAVEMKEKTVPLSFWPTAAGWIGESRVAIAGRTDRGRIVIEVWTLSPGGVQVGANPDTGESTYQTVLPRVRDIDLVYDNDVQGSGMIADLGHLLNSDSLLIQFRDGAVYSVPFEEGSSDPLLCVVSSSGGPGLYQTPGAIAPSWGGIRRGDHTTYGHTYQFYLSGGAFALVDVNRDGLVDDFIFKATEAEWRATGLDDFELYTKLYD